MTQVFPDSLPKGPLQAAARQQSVDAVQQLLTAGRFTQADLDGALADALRSGDPATQWTGMKSIATLLLGAGANPRQSHDEDQTTLLQYAAGHGHLAMVELLIQHGAKEWQPDKQGRTALDYAREGNSSDREQVIELLDRPVICDPIFKQAVSAIQSGDLPALRQLLAEHSHLIHDRAIEPDCYPRDYFRDPKLLWFVANNPNLIETMPANSVDIAAAMIDAGAEKSDLDYTLGLVMTSQPAREQHLQRPLMKLLLSRGATVTQRDLYSTLGHRELDAVAGLLESGLPLSAPIAASMGTVRELSEMIALTDSEQRHAALSMAVINRQLEAARLCLEAGADPNRFLIVNAHSLPIHQAAVNDDVPMLTLLVEHGAKLDIRDTLWNGTPLGWAIHTRQPAAERYLRSIKAP